MWQDLRRLPDQDAARRFKGARWALHKNPVDLNEDQAATLRKLKRRGGDLWRAYTLKEALRAVFAGDLSVEEVGALLDRFCSRASRSGLTLRHRSSDDPQAPRGHPRRRPARDQQRPSRRAESISCPRESSLPVEALGAPWSHLGPAASARSPDWAARITDSNRSSPATETPFPSDRRWSAKAAGFLSPSCGRREDVSQVSSLLGTPAGPTRR